MAWYNPFTWKIVTGGIDLEAEARRTEELNRKHAELDQVKYKRGILSEEDMEFIRAQREADAAAWQPQRYSAEVTEAAVEGAREGLGNVQSQFRQTLTGAVSAGVKGLAGFIPGWVWLVALAYVAFRLGLFDGLLAKWKRA